MTTQILTTDTISAGRAKINTGLANLQQVSFNVKTDYGAVGDGVTDDSAALNAAFAVSGKVFIPAGTYKVGSTITITASNLIIEGAGATNTILQATNTAGYESVLVATNKTNLTIRDLQIDAFQSLRVLNGQITRICGLFLTTCTDVLVDSVTVKNTVGGNTGSGIGIALAGGTRQMAQNCTLLNCGTALGPSDGIYSSGTQTIIANCLASACTDTGFVIEQSYQSGIVGCTALNCNCGGAITATSGAFNNECTGNFIMGLTVNGYNAANTGGVQIAALGTSNLTHTVVSGLTVIRTTGAGPCVAVRQTNTGIVRGLTLNGLNLDGNAGAAGAGTQGIILQATDVVITAPIITNTINACIQMLPAVVGPPAIAACDTVKIIGGKLTTAGVACIYSDGCNYVSVNDVRMIGGLNAQTTSYGVYFANTATSCRVTNCDMTGISTIAVGHDPGTVPSTLFPMYNVNGGLFFGAASNANLYYSNAGQFKTDNTFVSARGLQPGAFTTAGRPTGGDIAAGGMVFDTTLNKPIWRNAANTAWIDATGATV